MVFLITDIERVNGHLVIVTPTGKRLHTNGRLRIKHADPKRTGHDEADVPLYKRHRGQIICETEKASEVLCRMLAPIVVAKHQGKISSLSSDLRGVLTNALPPEMIQKIDPHSGDIIL